MLLRSKVNDKVYFVLKVDWLKFPDGDKTIQFRGVGESAAEKEIFKKLACKYFDIASDRVHINNPDHYKMSANIGDFIVSKFYVSEGTYSWAASEPGTRFIYGDELIDCFYKRLKEIDNG